MKDIIITGKRVKIELYTLLACFIIAEALNIFAIIKYHTKFSEIITTLGYIAIFTIALYVAWTIIRLCYYGIRYLIRKKSK
ncbi:MAG: hypothetical protein IJ726_02430 [Phocaeicola sp.]|nr:hypothetical protein [Phocaeicola sp.]